MDDALSLQYVKTTAELLMLPLEDAQAARVAVYLQRTAAMVRLLDSAGLDVHDELAEITAQRHFRLSIRRCPRRLCQQAQAYERTHEPARRRRADGGSCAPR